MSVTFPPGQWAIRHVPAVTTQATITQAAGGLLLRHYATGLTVTLGGIAATAAGLEFRLIDGASGGSTILWSGKLSNLINETTSISLGGVAIQGSQNTAMTLECTAAPATNVAATVSLIGFTA